MGLCVTISVRGVQNQPQGCTLCWSKAATLPEALRDVNTNEFSFPDSLNTKKKQLPQRHRNRKYPWVNIEDWFQPIVRDGKELRTI